MVTKTADALSDLYLADETAWLDSMAERIRAGRLDELDYAHLAEYLEDMAIRDRREVNSRLKVLILHLLKWDYQPDMRTSSWQASIMNQQDELEGLLESGTLRNHALASLATVYPKAVNLASAETTLPPSTFPAECPWTLDQLMSSEILGG